MACVIDEAYTLKHKQYITISMSKCNPFEFIVIQSVVFGKNHFKTIAIYF